jgi:hypothetical protein
MSLELRSRFYNIFYILFLVTLRSVIETPFKGYLLQMRRIDNQAIIAGFSVPNGGKLLTCDNQV